MKWTSPACCSNCEGQCDSVLTASLGGPTAHERLQEDTPNWPPQRDATATAQPVGPSVQPSPADRAHARRAAADT
jgi:hypothetical protein